MRGGGISLCTDWFTENSFHMQLFFFVSGYFYSDENENNVEHYLWKKILRLVIPLLLYNIFYGVFTTFLRNFGFSIGLPFSMYSVFVSSFLFGSEFKFNSPDWFIAQLFIVEVLNILFSKIFSTKQKYRNSTIIIIELILGIISIIRFANIDAPVYQVLIGRTLYAMSWYGIGRLYRMVEKYDRINNWMYFSVIICMDFIAIVTNEKTDISVVGFQFGELSVFESYFIPLLGIAFWIRICRLIGEDMLKNKLIDFIGKHTFSVVENQYLVFFILNTVYYSLYRLTNNMGEFDVEAYMSRHNFVHIVKDCDQTKVLYLIFGISVPLIISYLGELLRKKIKERYLYSSIL